MSIKPNIAIASLLLLSTVLISACSGQQTRTRSSIIEYLYPEKITDIIEPSIPVLKIPLKVGIAFVPKHPDSDYGTNQFSGKQITSSTLTEVQKLKLLEKIAERFKTYEFIDEIELIPSPYLVPEGSFSNLEQIQTMYDIDVIALVSYDQVQFTSENALSLTYWTLIGAYIISGEQNDTSTMVDTVVYDIASKKMLFRAPGTSNVKGKATPVNLIKALRDDSLTGFKAATNDMIENLDIQLSSFKEKIKNKPEKANVIYQKGYSGAGSFGPFEIILMVSLAFIAGLNKYRHSISSRLKK